MVCIMVLKRIKIKEKNFGKYWLNLLFFEYLFMCWCLYNIVLIFNFVVILVEMFFVRV